MQTGEEHPHNVILPGLPGFTWATWATSGYLSYLGPPGFTCVTWAYLGHLGHLSYPRKTCWKYFIHPYTLAYHRTAHRLHKLWIRNPIQRNSTVVQALSDLSFSRKACNVLWNSSTTILLALTALCDTNPACFVGKVAKPRHKNKYIYIFVM